MSEMKSLAKDTAIYGLSSIIGKFLNYLLVPLYTYALARTSEYGIVTNIYAWTALLLVLLTYGMETGFFRFANRDDFDARTVYKTSYFTLFISSALFTLLVIIFHQPIAIVLGYPDHAEFVEMMFATVAIDAFASIPFAYLRYQKRPILFAALKLLFVLLNIAFNILFLIVLGKNDVFYVFLSNILATTIQTLCLLPFTLPRGGRFDVAVLREMLRYSLPLLVLGVAGIMNQTLDRILFPYLYTGDDAQAQLGIYGACFKVAMVMMMFTQAFRYAYEPFVFAKHKDRKSVEAYADAMKYYIIFSYLILLGVIFYLDIFRYIVSSAYWEGLKIVPVVLWTYVFQGIYFNLSFWYKLTDETKWGAYFSLIGLAITLVLQIIGVPLIGYWASCGSSLVCYFVIMLLSYFIGQKKAPIPYDLKTIGGYTALTLGLLGVYYAFRLYYVQNMWALMGIGTILIGIYLFILTRKDFPIQNVLRNRRNNGSGR
ncbi:MAG: oligosaccharide flippase family protein [Bacteroidales bacterium]|nr:oligosaccharide flippase family protein [Bacteroidales bacterium]MDY6406225.1 oligosaccharide flippase family protein [Bacteroidales bacterium]